MKPVNRSRAAGLSLIELMIALLIGIVLLLGVVQIFAASRTAYQLSEGLARTQENGRFAMDYLQRDIRMAGHYGCINDQARLQTAGALNTHFTIADNPLNFNVSIRGYEAVGSAPTNTINLSSLPSGGWSPALPAFLSGLSPAPRAGSDIIVLRYLTSDGVPVTNLAASQVTVDPGKWNVLTNDGVANPRLFGIADCTYADIFHGSSVSPGTGVVTASASLPNVTVPDFTGRYTASPSGQTMLYRAESVAYYVATGTGGGPSLYRARYGSTTAASAVTEELVEGIENLQFIYGQDEAPLAALSGNITAYNTAQTLGTVEADWRRVGQVQVGVLARSPNAAAAVAATNPLRALGTTYSGPTPTDSRFRTTYESTIALRNRLYGN